MREKKQGKHTSRSTFENQTCSKIDQQKEQQKANRANTKTKAAQETRQKKEHS